MYLKKLRLQNIRCFEDVGIEFPHSGGNYGGWNVILGPNGFGKSTILGAIAECALESIAHSWTHDDDWVRDKATAGQMEATFLATKFDDHDVRVGSAERGPTAGGTKRQLTIHSVLERGEIEWESKTLRPKKHNTPGWVVCGYGPFRRLTRTPEITNLPAGYDQFRTLLDDRLGISEPFAWLREVYGRSIDPKASNRDILRRSFPVLVETVNQLLPGGVKVKDVSTERVSFRTMSGVTADPLRLSDGYRSFLALAVDLLMRVFQATDRFHEYVVVDTDTGTPRILADGIVLIDEADAHLHPSWQRELGERLRRVFPKIQFIVTTHSPFIAQEATDEGLFILRPTKKGTVEVEKFGESVRGWTATQILTSPAFGLHSTRSVETEQLVQRNSELVSKERAGKLTATEKKEFRQIRKALETQLSAPGETYDEMNRQEEIQRYVAESLKRINNGKS
ncbi:MAG TPA: AAA family ATPase [Urbifossiella sp.]|nr:AAA family ATPase [Urbifossiella sp.]